MSEFLLELYSEEIPPQLQINAREELKENFEKLLKEEKLEYKKINVLFITNKISSCN